VRGAAGVRGGGLWQAGRRAHRVAGSGEQDVQPSEVVRGDSVRRAGRRALVGVCGGHRRELFFSAIRS
jgi:hypothetical protein